MPTRRPSHRVRNISFGVIGVFVLLAAIGSATNRPTSFAAPTVPPDAGASDEVTPAPPGTTLFTFEGTGPMTSDPFQSSGETVEVAYDYTCTAEDTFTINFYGTYDTPLLPDVLVSEFGASGSGTAAESLNGTTGPFTVEVDTPCKWSIEVAGTP